MKKRNLLYAALILFIVVAFSSCFHDHDISVHINDDADEYRLRASFDDNLTNKIQWVINKHLHKHHSRVLVKEYTDKEITLDDGTVFYVKSSPGRLKIKFNREENTGENCEELELMCDEIKEVLAGQDDNN
ncbi:MAG TPA: hypothetical protein PLZ45_13750 [Ferruginibacter sp.]|nr:hypothetical protein [Ferruginibacter sp.]